MATPKGRPTRDRTTASAHASRLHSLRQTSGLSLRKVADKLGIERSTVSRWENGMSEGWRTCVPALAELYGVAPEEVVGETGCGGSANASSFVQAAVREAQRREPRLAEAIALASVAVEADHFEWLAGALQRRGRALAAEAASRLEAPGASIYRLSGEQLRSALPHFQDTTSIVTIDLDLGELKEVGLTSAQARDVRTHTHTHRPQAAARVAGKPPAGSYLAQDPDQRL